MFKLNCVLASHVYFRVSFVTSGVMSISVIIQLIDLCFRFSPDFFFGNPKVPFKQSLIEHPQPLLQVK